MAYYKYDTSKPEPVKKNSFQPYISLVVFLAVAVAVLAVCFNLGKKALDDNSPEVVLLKPQVDQKYAFGEYETGKALSFDNNIFWWVLAIDGDRYLLCSVNAIDSLPFNSANMSKRPWKDSDIRKWLNGEFYEKAFSKSLKKRIILSSVINSDESVTEDRIFLLSREETERYKAPMRVKASEFAVRHGASDGDSCVFWLRDSGTDSGKIMVFDRKGILNEKGLSADSTGIGVRPAMWVEIKNSSDSSSK